VSPHDWSANTWQNKLILGGTLLAIFIVLPTAWTIYSGHRNNAKEAHASQASLERAEGGWSKRYSETTCAEFNGEMTTGQRLLAAEALLEGQRSLDELDEAQSTVVADFANDLSTRCAGESPSAMIYLVAIDVYASRVEFSQM
jgi:hypothetical protein